MSSASPAKLFPSSAPATEPTTSGSPRLHIHSGEDFTQHRRQYSEAEWQTKRLLIKQLYMDAKKPLKQVMSIMSQKYNFHPTQKMYKTRLETWGFAKNYTSARAIEQLRQKRERDAVNKVSKSGRKGGNIGKYMARTKKAVEIFAAVERDWNVRSSDEASMHSPSGDRGPSTYPSVHGDYEHNCPYSQWTKKFRLIEELPSDSLYEGDSFGFHSYIATDEERPCTERCFCHQHDVSKAFSFVVYKSSSKIDITIFSDDLFSKLRELLDSTRSQIAFIDGQRIANGLDLLKHYNILKSYLGSLASGLPDSSMTHSPFSEMELLVDGLLADGEVFKSFGYENLYERGFLDFKTWKKFQQAKLQRDISALDEGFWEVDGDLGELTTPPMQHSSSGQQSMDFEFGFLADDFEEPPAYSEHSHPGDAWSTEFEGITNNDNDCDNDSEQLPTFAEETSPLWKTWFEFPLIHAARAGHIDVVRYLLDQGADINQGGLTTPLSETTRAEYTQMVYSLREQRSNVNSGMKRQTTPLIEAASAGHLEVVQLLLDRGAGMGYEIFATSLAEAVDTGHVAVLQLLVDWNADVPRCLWERKQDPDGVNIPLIEATKAGYVAVEKLFSYNGISIYGDKNRRSTLARPLAGAAKAGCSAVVKLLLDWGADKSLINSQDLAALLGDAAKAGHIAVVQLLLDRGASVLKYGYLSSSTPLDEAAKTGQVAVVKLLLAQVNLKMLRRTYGCLALDKAAKAGHVAVVQLLLDDIDITDSKDLLTSLFEAATAGHVEVVKLLLDRGADIHRVYVAHTSTWVAAVEAGQVAVVQLFLERGGGIDGVGSWRLGGCLYKAAYAGHVDMVKLLLDQGVDINERSDYSGKTPLLAAAEVGNIALVQLFLDRGVDVNQRSSWDGKTPLIAAGAGGHVTVVQLLLDRGANINACSDRSGKTPLLAAVERGYIAVVRLLLDQGADINIYSYHRSKTPLIVAIEGGYTEIVQLLLDRGVDINERSGSSWYDIPPLIAAIKGGCAEVVQLLLGRGADIKESSYYGETPLLAAIKGGCAEVVQLLLGRGADINERAYDGETPLLAAGEGGHIAVVQLLLDRGVDAHITGYMLWITRLAEAAGAGNISLKCLLQDRLIVAAASGQTEEMRALLKNGVDINAVTPRGTALSTAVRSGYESSIRWLLRKGADVHAAAAILQRFDDAKFTMARLFKSEAWVRNSEYARNMLRSQHHDSRRAKNLLYLHSRFKAQHRLMLDATQRSSTEFRDLSQMFPGYREAWSAGIRTLRRLCSGDPPRNLSDTIAFLCLAKAISETLPEIGGCDRSEQFFVDLRRWQYLFYSEADSHAYRDAVYSMWGVILDKNLLDPNKVDHDDFIYFQELASTLVSQASESFDFDTLNYMGLEASQQRWQLRNDINAPSTNSSAIPPDIGWQMRNDINSPSTNSSAVPPDIRQTVAADAQPPQFVPPLPPDLPVRPSERSLQQAAAADVSSATIEPIVILLMAGTIFAIVVVFLHWLGNISAGYASSPSIFASIDTMEQRCHLLEMYMGLKSWKPYDDKGKFTCSGKGKGILQPEDFFDFESYFA